MRNNTMKNTHRSPVSLRLLSRLFLAGLSAALLTGCVTSQDMAKALSDPSRLSAAVAPKAMTPEAEKNLGKTSAALLLGAAPLVRNDALQAYVNRVGRWVASQTGRNDIDWSFGVIDTPNVNAFATPGGTILITRGLFARLKNEAELAGVLGHEIAHVTERHYVKAAQKKEQAGALAGIASDLTAQNNSALGKMAINLTRGIYTSGLDKDDEFDADRIGIAYAGRAGYHPYGLPQVLQMYAANSGEAGFDLFFSTHPSPQDRLDRLGRLMDNQYAPLEANSVRDTASFRKMQEKFAQR